MLTKWFLLNLEKMEICITHKCNSASRCFYTHEVAPLSILWLCERERGDKPHSLGRVAFSGEAERKPVPEGVTASASEGHVQSSAGVDTVGCHGTDTFGKMMALSVVTSMGLKISCGSTIRSRPPLGLYRTMTTSPEERSSAWTTLAASCPGARHSGGTDQVWLGRRIGRWSERLNTRTPYSPVSADKKPVRWTSKNSRD